MSQREYSEDTVFWSLKRSTQFSARRRTLQLFLANPKPGTPFSHTWIDNTPEVFNSLRRVLETQDPKSIALNVDDTIAFSSGLHAGELNVLVRELGIGPWLERAVTEPMIAVEFVATMPKDQLTWYRNLQETAWAMISEAFSSSVIEAGVTTTEVPHPSLKLSFPPFSYTLSPPPAIHNPPTQKLNPQTRTSNGGSAPNSNP